MRSTFFVAASLACFSYVSASFWPGYPSPDASQSVECGNTNAAVGINVGNDINCQVNQGGNTSPYPAPYPNPYAPNPDPTTAQDVNCGNSVGGVIVNVGDRVNCEVNQAHSDSYPYNPYGWSPYPYQAKEVKVSLPTGPRHLIPGLNPAERSK
jgi:hypothetical protein